MGVSNKNQGVSNENIGVSKKYGGFQRTSGVSNSTPVWWWLNRSDPNLLCQLSMARRQGEEKENLITIKMATRWTVECYIVQRKLILMLIV